VRKNFIKARTYLNHLKSGNIASLLCRNLITTIEDIESESGRFPRVVINLWSGGKGRKYCQPLAPVFISLETLLMENLKRNIASIPLYSKITDSALSPIARRYDNRELPRPCREIMGACWQGKSKVYLMRKNPWVLAKEDSKDGWSSTAVLQYGAFNLFRVLIALFSNRYYRAQLNRQKSSLNIDLICSGLDMVQAINRSNISPLKPINGLRVRTGTKLTPLLKE